jgi:hypothetical protein
MSETRQIAIDLLQATTPGKMEEVVKRLLEHERKKMLAALPPAMTWTTEKPTKAGWYWYHCDGQDDKIVVYVDKNMVVEQGAWHVSEITGQWCGPLEPPQ